MVLTTGKVDIRAYGRVFPSENDLFVMDDDSQTRLTLDAFGSLGKRY
jgi:hypothetical protein